MMSIVVEGISTLLLWKIISCTKIASDFIWATFNAAIFQSLNGKRLGDLPYGQKPFQDKTPWIE